jgi:ATP-dependent DNA ligase
MMRAFANDIIKGNGEGVILREPCSVYQNGVSNMVVKYKVCLVGFIICGRTEFEKIVI